jgi:hypothetical protein
MGSRARFDNDSLRAGSVDKKVRAFASYFSYGGRYSVDGDTITHHVLFCLSPNWVGTPQVRRFALGPESATLPLWTVNPTVIQGEETYACHTWCRA